MTFSAVRPLSGLLTYSTDPLVSRDVIGDPSSCIFDSGLTQAAGPLVKDFGWYDNEWATQAAWLTWPLSLPSALSQQEMSRRTRYGKHADRGMSRRL